MICKEGTIDVISIGGVSSANVNGAMSGHNTLQNRRKSQLITFSASSCDIKNSLSHEIILVNNGGNGRGSVAGSISNGSGGGVCNARLSFAEEDIMIVTTNGVNGGGSASVSAGSGSGGSGSGHDADLDDDVFRRRSLEVDEEIEELFDDEYGTHIERSNNANDDSGGGSYEDSHALHSSMGGSNRNSLEKDDDDIEVDVISTDLSCCYDQLLGSSCNTRNDEDDIATLVGDGDNYTKLIKSNANAAGLNGDGGGIGETGGGIIYANPFMDDEGIAESGM